jgi:hypothetical protein
MIAKLNRRWSYALVLSIVVLAEGFLGVGVRAFASAVISHSVFLAALGIVLLILPLYFALRRPRTPGAIKRKSFGGQDTFRRSDTIAERQQGRGGRGRHTGLNGEVSGSRDSQGRKLFRRSDAHKPDFAG